MSLLDRLDDRFGQYGVPQVTVVLIAAQVIVYVLVMGVPEQAGADEPLTSRLMLVPERVLDGEVWRLFTFLAIPPLANIVFAFIFWYLFWLMGTTLEYCWGTFRYNMFLLIGYLATVGSSFLSLQVPAQNWFLEGSVFLAFAYLFPDFTVLLMFVLPVKVRWLAVVIWLGFGLTFVVGSWPTRIQILASVANFLVFFGRDLVRSLRAHPWVAGPVQRFAPADKPFHTCTVCGITDKSHPQMDFRYCSKCDGAHGYCSEHLTSHEHKQAGQA